MSYKVTTTDINEAKATGKVYLDKQFFIDIKRINKNPPIRRCGYRNCNVILKDNRIEKNKLFCSDWCREQEDLMNYKDKKRKCSSCDGYVYPTERKNISNNGNIRYTSSGVYPKYCEDCIKNKVWYKKKKI